jgi:hypothetical protein
MSWAVHVARIGGEERSIHVLLAALSCQCTSYSPDDSLFKQKHVAYCTLYLAFGVTTWNKRSNSVIANTTELSNLKIIY